MKTRKNPMGSFSQLKSEWCTRMQILPEPLRESGNEDGAASSSENDNRKMARLQILVRTGAREVRDRWRKADKKKVAKKIVFSLALNAILVQIPFASEIPNPLTRSMHEPV
jgi:hypothetical protein